jgi:hypothetical protein
MGSQAGETFFLERVTLEESDDEDFEYDAVDVESEASLDEDKDDDFETLAKAARAKEATLAGDGKGDISEKKLQPVMTQRPEVVDDFIRNFLNKMNLTKTLDMFQTEWYELQQKGLLKETDISLVPDVYLRNQQLDDSVQVLHAELQQAREVAEQARGTWDKFRKERDYHRMHHKRVVQEKNKLVQDLKRLRAHTAMYEPTMQGLQRKYELAMKEKSMAKLERDKMLKKMDQLEAALSGLQVSAPLFSPTSHPLRL